VKDPDITVYVLHDPSYAYTESDEAVLQHTIPSVHQNPYLPTEDFRLRNGYKHRFHSQPEAAWTYLSSQTVPAPYVLQAPPDVVPAYVLLAEKLSEKQLYQK